MATSVFQITGASTATLQTYASTIEVYATQAQTSATNAAASATSASNSAASTSTNATTAATKATEAATSATNALASENAANTSAVNAAASATTASGHASTASTQASNASSSATTASSQATAAAASATTASSEASAAATSETNAATSATNAATSETNAATSETNAATSETNASTSASNASTSATNAASSASAASTSETNAATSESNASTSATNAATSASTASTQATNASNSATAAATSATNAASSATSAASSASTAQTLSDDFGEKYRIASTAPTTSLDVGDLYFDTTQNELKVYKSSGWAAAGSTVNGTSARFHYDITGTPTSVSGADANGNTLAYDAGYVDVYVNGVRMSDADITITSGNTITFTEALSNGDEVDIVAYGTFVATVLNADNLDSGTVPDARITGAYTGITNLTMSGDLTVDTNTLKVDSSNNYVGIGIASPSATLHLDASGGAFMKLERTGQGHLFLSTDGTNGSIRTSSASGALKFQTNGNNERMRIDSNGNVLVGGTSFNNGAFGGTSKGINVAGTQPIVLLHETDTDKDGYLGIANSIFRLTTADSIPITFATNDIERMRIDSSGNLLVGKTSPNVASVGFEAKSDGANFMTRDGGEPLKINRKTSDGNLLAFAKDGTTVGSIGVNGTSQVLYFIADDTGIGVNKVVDAVYPIGSNLGARDNAVDLGVADTGRWKDLHLSGGVYLGGTGSANKLDDYEEGSFTPTFGGSGGNQTVSYAFQFGTYVKVGKLVFINISVGATGTPSGGSGDLIINGLPFTSKSGVQQAGSMAFANYISFGSSGTQGYCNIEGGVTYLNINSQELVGTSSMSRVPASGIHNTDPRIVCTICYETA